MPRRLSWRRMKAEVVHYYAYDIGGEVRTQSLRELLGRPLAPLVIAPYRRSPAGFFFYRPLAAELDPIAAVGPDGPLPVRVSARIAEVGAMSIVARTTMEWNHIRDLHAGYNLRVDGKKLDDAVRELSIRIFESIRPHVIQPTDRLVEPETYTAFCLNSEFLGAESATAWLNRCRPDVVALLAEDPDAARLSEQEVRESLQYQFSYYDNDIVVIDWDGALVIDDPRAYDELLYLFELGNLQLEELTEYDRILDAAMDRAYDDLQPRAAPPARTRRRMLAELREIRVDLARMSDELSNTTKFFGDWHVARIYEGVARRFHLADWANSVGQKLRTLEGMYNLLQQERTNQWMLVLEAMIVGLFLIDLAALVWLAH